jgi:hypothetical protein
VNITTGCQYILAARGLLWGVGKTMNSLTEMLEQNVSDRSENLHYWINST